MWLDAKIPGNAPTAPEAISRTFTDMTDVVDKATRSRMMSGIRGKDTAPERMIRSELHRRGFRFRLHYPGLPGRPDLVLPKYRVVIQVNGCFWHRHGCRLFKWPSTNIEKWRAKLEANVVRDEMNVRQYKDLGWRTLLIWECALKGPGRLKLGRIVDEIELWLRSSSDFAEIEGKDFDR